MAKSVKSLDAGLASILPPFSLVKEWHTALQSDRSCPIRAQAFEAYQKLIAEKPDKELLKFMPSQIQWPEFVNQGASRSVRSEGTGLIDMQYFLLHAAASEQAVLQNILEQLYTGESPLQLMIAACYNNAYVLFIPKDVEQVSLQLPWTVSQVSAQLLIVMVEEGASVTLRNQSHLPAEGIYFRALFAHVGSYANVTLMHDQSYGANTSMLSSESWLLATQSSVTAVTGLTGGKQTWCSMDYKLQGHNAHAEHLMLAALKNNEQSALITRQQHQAESTTSSLEVKTLLVDEARSFFRGTISVNETALQSDADQQQRALLLSPRARTCAIPSLEVSTHEVKCRHGSAAGRFDKEQLWYVQSRGLDKKEAYYLLIDGFYNDHPLMQRHAGLVDGMLRRLKGFVEFD